MGGLTLNGIVKILLVCAIILAATLILVFVWPHKPEASEQEAAAPVRGKK